MSVAVSGKPEIVTQIPQTIGVLICSYRRPDQLMRGLDGLALQRRRPDDVIVVVREEDAATHAALADRANDELLVRVIVVKQPGTVHALNAGLDAVRTDVIAITDDDTVPRPDWADRILTHFQNDPELGGLGGRDWMYDSKGMVNNGSATCVGKLQWFGRTIGNHHLGVGGMRRVDLLKGANMSYRTLSIRSIRFDRRLRGRGAQPAEDLCFSLNVRRSGWQLSYNPAVAVDHYSGERSEPRHYSGISREGVEGMVDFAHNEVVAIWDALSAPRQFAYILWCMLVGTKVSPGLLQAIVLSRQLGWLSWRRFWAVQQGKLQGWHTVRLRHSENGPEVQSAN